LAIESEEVGLVDGVGSMPGTEPKHLISSKIPAAQAISLATTRTYSSIGILLKGNRLSPTNVCFFIYLKGGRTMVNLFTSKAIGVGVLGLVFCAAVSTGALAEEKAVYDGMPDVEQPGTTIHGKVVKIQKRDADTYKWDVSVKNVATGEVVLLHLDKTTQMKEKAPDPALGDMVVVKYDDHSKHALTFLKDGSPSPNPTP
jgi:hypothetical protein